MQDLGGAEGRAHLPGLDRRGHDYHLPKRGGDGTLYHPLRRGIQTVVQEAKELGLERVAVVAHGGTWLVGMASFGRPERKLYEWQLKNCGVFRVSVQENPFSILTEIFPIFRSLSRLAI